MLQRCGVVHKPAAFVYICREQISDMKKLPVWTSSIVNTNHAFVFWLLCCSFFSQPTSAQTKVEAFVFETNNRGFLNQAKVEVLSVATGAVLETAQSDANGRVLFTLAPGSYAFRTTKDLFLERIDTVTLDQAPVYLKIALQRRPGYIFDASLAEARDDENTIVDAISGATIEIFNHTADSVALLLKQHPEAFFRFTFEQGNHYTILIRKPGYSAKRIEAYVNIEGCILCLHGLNDFRPGVSENMTAGNTMGTLVANIELRRTTGVPPDESEHLRWIPLADMIQLEKQKSLSRD